jgi:hypothetical protein
MFIFARSLAASFVQRIAQPWSARDSISGLLTFLPVNEPVELHSHNYKCLLDFSLKLCKVMLSTAISFHVSLDGIIWSNIVWPVVAKIAFLWPCLDFMFFHSSLIWISLAVALKKDSGCFTMGGNF